MYDHCSYIKLELFLTDLYNDVYMSKQMSDIPYTDLAENPCTTVDFIFSDNVLKYFSHVHVSNDTNTVNVLHTVKVSCPANVLLTCIHVICGSILSTVQFGIFFCSKCIVNVIYYNTQCKDILFINNRLQLQCTQNKIKYQTVPRILHNVNLNTLHIYTHIYTYVERLKRMPRYKLDE